MTCPGLDSAVEELEPGPTTVIPGPFAAGINFVFDDDENRIKVFIPAHHRLFEKDGAGVVINAVVGKTGQDAAGGDDLASESIPDFQRDLFGVEKNILFRHMVQAGGPVSLDLVLGKILAGVR